MIKTKRDSLENFIRSQMLGPGACNNRFGFIQEDESNEIVEIINTTPGSLYSTGVLFPKRKVKQTSNSTSEILQENVDDDKIDNEEDEESADRSSLIRPVADGTNVTICHCAAPQARSLAVESCPGKPKGLLQQINQRTWRAFSMVRAGTVFLVAERLPCNPCFRAVPPLLWP